MDRLTRITKLLLILLNKIVRQDVLPRYQIAPEAVKWTELVFLGIVSTNSKLVQKQIESTIVMSIYFKWLR